MLIRLILKTAIGDIAEHRYRADDPVRGHQQQHDEESCPRRPEPAGLVDDVERQYGHGEVAQHGHEPDQRIEPEPKLG